MRNVAQIIRDEGCQDIFFLNILRNLVSPSIVQPLFFTVCAARFSFERSWNIPESHVAQSVPARRLHGHNNSGHVVHPCCTQRFVNDTYGYIAPSETQRKMRQTLHVVGIDNNPTIIARHKQSWTCVETTQKRKFRFKNVQHDVSRGTCCARANVDDVLRT